MKKVSVVIAAGLLSAAMLAGCNIQSPTVDVNTIITDTQTACKFVPTASTVLAVLNVLPAGAAVNVIVNALCAAAGGVHGPEAAASTTDHVVAKTVINGKTVEISGHFVR